MFLQIYRQENMITDSAHMPKLKMCPIISLIIYQQRQIEVVIVQLLCSSLIFHYQCSRVKLVRLIPLSAFYFPIDAL